MKFLIFLVTTVLLASCRAYTIRDSDEAFASVNPATFEYYLKCFNDRGPCNPFAEDIKKIIPDAVRKACAKCGPPEKHFFKRLVNVAGPIFPNLMQDFKKKYDPGNKFFKG